MNHHEYKNPQDEPRKTVDEAGELVLSAMNIDDQGQEFIDRVDEAFMDNKIPMLAQAAARLEFINDTDPDTIDDAESRPFLHLADMRDAILIRASLLSYAERRVYYDAHDKERDKMQAELKNIEIIEPFGES